MKNQMSEKLAHWSVQLALMICVTLSQAQAQSARPEANAATVTRSATSGPVTAVGAEQPARGLVMTSTLSSPSNLRLPPNIQAIRRFDLKALTGPQSVSIGAQKLNVAQLKGPQNLLLRQAEAISKLQGLVRIEALDSELIEIPNGVLVNQKLSYKVRIGACSSKRELLNQAGVQCGTRKNLAGTTALLRQAGSERYIADPQQRQLAERDLAGTKDEVIRQVAQTRRFLNSPDALRELGSAEVSRLQALSEEDLAVEMLNAAETTIEEAFFIPLISDLKHFPAMTNMAPQLTPETIALMQRMAAPREGAEATAPPAQTGRNAGSRNQRDQQAARQTVSKSVNAVFLTGFTLGKNYEWQKRFSKTVYWCVVGCKETYYIEPYVNLGYGLGLRFPIRMTLDYEWKGSGWWATVKPTFTAFNGDAAAYQQAGLERGKVFDGKEIVAEYTAVAGIRYRLPRVGTQKTEYRSSKDFTERLPRPYTNGQFDPPESGRRGLRSFEKFLTDIDLLMGYGDYGVVAAKLFPGVKVDLTSDSLKFAFKDLEGSPERESRISSGATQRVKINPANGMSQIAIGKPIYNLAFTVTPGVQYRVTVDLGIWGHTWRDVIWIPSLEIQLPPGGVDFSCHAGTRCSRNYVFETGHVAQITQNSSTTERSATSSRPDGDATRASAPSPASHGSSNRAAATTPGSTSSRAAGSCERTTTQGIWSFKQVTTGRLARGGVTAEGRNDMVGLGTTQPPRDPRRAWETFELFDIPGVQYGRWLRNTIDGRWLETINETGTLNLKKGRGCNTSIKDMQWKVLPVGGGRYLLQNLNSMRYVRVLSSGLLRADTDRKNATVFHWNHH
jgi:hypothetical protein